MELKKPEMMEKAAKSRESIGSLGLQILCFIVVFIVINLLESIPLIILMFRDIFNIGSDITPEIITSIMNKYQHPTGNILIVMLFTTIFSIIVSIIYCKFIEKRSLASMGIVKKHAVKNYIFGLFIGFILFTAIVALNITFGAMKFDGINSNIIVGIVIVYAIGFAIQGASEEILCRGYLMNSIGGKHSVWLAVIISSLFFAMLHLANPGLTLLAFANLFLFGLFAAFYIICFDDIWGACAIHSIWNFAQGIIYGISVSGVYNETNSIMFLKNVEGMSFINGGTFGAEGGAAVTFVLLIGILILIGYMLHSKKIVNNKSTKSVESNS